jgi:hypothetical protein
LGRSTDTINWAIPEIFPDLATIEAVPGLLALAVTNPALLMVATLVSKENHDTDVVISCVVPSEYVPYAVICMVPFLYMYELAGITLIEDNVAPPPPPPSDGAPPPPPPPPPQDAVMAMVRRRSIAKRYLLYPLFCFILLPPFVL